MYDIMLKKNEDNNTFPESKGKKLHVTCFGDFKVVFEPEKEVMPWRTKRAKELFAFLIHMQGKPVERKMIIEKLWLDKGQDYSITVLHNIIYNIRERLEPYGLRKVIEHEDGRYRINQEQIFTDLSGMLPVASAVEENDLQRLKNVQDRLLDYKGRYLENIEGAWHMEWTEYFEVIHIKGCYMIAEEKLRTERPEEAIPYLNIGLGIDMYSEKLAGLLIRSYGKLRDFRNVKKQYEKYLKILKEDLGIRHSEILESAYRECIGKRE